MPKLTKCPRCKDKSYCKACDVCRLCSRPFTCALSCKNNEEGAAGLVQIALAALKDDRHWTTGDVADRAANSTWLATAVLEYFDQLDNGCDRDCKGCADTAAATG